MCSLLTDQDVVNRQVLGDLVEYESSTIRRVVRSTMAAESAALSKSLDRQLYLRLMVETLLYGQPELQEGLAYCVAYSWNTRDGRQELV